MSKMDQQQIREHSVTTAIAAIEPGWLSNAACRSLVSVVLIIEMYKE
jgi:hypothetical protein